MPSLVLYIEFTVALSSNYGNELTVCPELDLSQLTKLIKGARELEQRSKCLVVAIYYLIHTFQGLYGRTLSARAHIRLIFNVSDPI